jgi:ankyrin repeat protein
VWNITCYCISEGHAALINKWREEDKLFYDKTQGFTATLKMVNAKKYMTIIGGPGSGKTATARHIALQLEELGWEAVPVCELKDIRDYGDRGHKQVFVLDDVVGIFAVDMGHMIHRQEDIVTAIGEKSKLLFTCRMSVYKEAFKLGLFVTENVVDLQSEDNQLTETEKKAIFQYHCKSKGVNPDLYTSFSFTKANHMFPLLCKLFSMEEKYQRLGKEFFNKPFDYFIKELDKLQLTCTIQYAVLVLCLVNEGKLSVDVLPHEPMRKEVFDCCGVDLGTPAKKIKDAIYHMSETYFTKLGTAYTFTHDFIFEAIAYHYVQSQIDHQNQQIFKYLPSSYIANKVTVYEQDSNEDHCIQISEKMYSQLAERLYKDIQSMNLFDVFMNKSLKHGPFLGVFEEMLKTKPFDEFESLILRKHENIHQFVQKIPSSKEDIKKQYCIVERRRLPLLFHSVHNGKSEGSFRVINWIIGYGHTHLLKEIINHVECNKYSINLIFGSNVEETTHLLMLGCYSNTLDMVELMLKYVEPKFIKMDYTFFDIENIFNRIYSPLMAACVTGNLCIVKALLRENADVNECNYSKESPLVVAVEHGHMDIVEYLVSYGAEVSVCDFCGHSLLFIASKEGHCDIVKYLLADNADVNQQGILGGTLLYVASQSGHCDIVKYLVDHNADVNLTDKNNRSPLYSAAEMGHYDIVLFLLQKGADVNISDVNKKSSLYVDNMSPLSIAVHNGHFDIVKYFIEYSTEFDLSDTGKSLLFLAAEGGYPNILVLLLHSKYNDITKTYLGTTPLEIAVWRNKSKVVQLLIQEENKLKKYQGNYHLLQILTDLKRSEFCINEETDIEDCHVQDSNHRHLPFPLWDILIYGNNDYLTHLLKIGLDIHKRDYNGNTLFYKILNGTKCMYVDKFESLMENFEVRGKKWISLLKKRKQVCFIGLICCYSITNFTFDSETLIEFRKHIRRHSI